MKKLKRNVFTWLNLTFSKFVLLMASIAVNSVSLMGIYEHKIPESLINDDSKK
jgi:hypothetical protein